MLQKYSYGRQIGRLAEALAVLVAERDPLEAESRFDEFREMNAEIEKIKGQSAAARVQRLIDDLDSLTKTLGADDAKHLRTELRKRLTR